MDTIEKTKLELAFDEFNSLMDKYNEEFASAKDEKEQEEVQSKYDKLIEDQKNSLEASVELDFKESQEALAKEEAAFDQALKDSEDEIKKLEKELEKENGGEVYDDDTVGDDEGISKEEILKMNEPSLVRYANSLGIDASVSDKKSETLKKVLSTLGL